MREGDGSVSICLGPPLKLIGNSFRIHPRLYHPPPSPQLLAMPAVRKRWHLLPSSLIPALKAHEGGAPQHHILRPIGVPPELSELNQVLPPAQYGDGEGMAFLLSRPMSSSDTNLKDLDKPSGQSGVE